MSKKKKTVKKNSKKLESKIKKTVKEVGKETKKTVKEIENETRTSKKTKEIENWKVITTILILIIIIIGGLFLILTEIPFYKYSFEVNGVPYYSDYYTPGEFLQTIKQEEKVFVSPILREDEISLTTVNALLLWNVVLNINGVEVEQLIRVKEGNELKYCYTNEGKVELNEQITVEECEQKLRSDNWIILIEEGRERVIIDWKKVIVTSPEQRTSMTNFAIIEEIFPNAREALEKVNQIIYGIQ